MAKCHRCGKSGLFLKINSIGLCPQCARYFELYIARNIEVFLESSKIIGQTQNLCAKISRCNVALQQLRTIQDFNTENYDVFKETSRSSNSTDEMIALHIRILSPLNEAYSGFEHIIFMLIKEMGSVSKRDVIKKSEETLQKIGQPSPFDLEKSVPDILDEMTDAGKLTKNKVGNRYKYSIA